MRTLKDFFFNVLFPIVLMWIGGVLFPIALMWVGLEVSGSDSPVMWKILGGAAFVVGALLFASNFWGNEK